jgi:hypothetical protein
LGELSQARELIGYLEQLLEQLEVGGQACADYESLRAAEQSASGRLERAAEMRRTLFQQAVDSGSGYAVMERAIDTTILFIELETYDEAEPIIRRGIEAADQLRAARDVCRALLTVVQARRGEVAQARRTFEGAERAFAEHSLAWPGVVLQIARAELLAAERSWQPAFEAFAEAVDGAERAEARHPRLLWLQGWARAHLRRGEPEDLQRARDLLEAAAMEYEQIGSPDYAERVRVQLEAIGS